MRALASSFRQIDSSPANFLQQKNPYRFRFPNPSLFRDSRLSPVYPQIFIYIYQCFKKIFCKFHSLLLSTGLFHFFYSPALDRIDSTGLVKVIGWRSRIGNPDLQ